jgi:AhpC/TSA family protein
MTRLRILVLGALLAAGAPLAHAEDALPTPLGLGSPAPMAEVKMKGVDGRERSIADVRGAKGTLVVFSCNACPWAKAWESRIVELGNAAGRRGIGVMVINANDPGVSQEDGYDTMRQRARQRGMKYPYVVDATSEVARAFGATRTPEAFLFSADGKLVYHGTIDDNAREPGKVERRYLKDALDAVVAGKAVPVAETKALGCSIKFRARG